MSLRLHCLYLKQLLEVFCVDGVVLFSLQICESAKCCQ